MPSHDKGKNADEKNDLIPTINDYNQRLRKTISDSLERHKKKLKVYSKVGESILESVNQMIFANKLVQNYSMSSNTIGNLDVKLVQGHMGKLEKMQNLVNEYVEAESDIETLLFENLFQYFLDELDNIQQLQTSANKVIQSNRPMANKLRYDLALVKTGKIKGKSLPNKMEELIAQTSLELPLRRIVNNGIVAINRIESYAMLSKVIPSDWEQINVYFETGMKIIISNLYEDHGQISTDCSYEALNKKMEEGLKKLKNNTREAQKESQNNKDDISKEFELYIKKTLPEGFTSAYKIGSFNIETIQSKSIEKVKTAIELSEKTCNEINDGIFNLINDFFIRIITGEGDHTLFKDISEELFYKLAKLLKFKWLILMDYYNLKFYNSRISNEKPFIKDIKEDFPLQAYSEFIRKAKQSTSQSIVAYCTALDMTEPFPLFLASKYLKLLKPANSNLANNKDRISNFFKWINGSGNLDLNTLEFNDWIFVCIKYLSSLECSLLSPIFKNLSKKKDNLSKFEDLDFITSHMKKNLHPLEITTFNLIIMIINSIPSDIKGNTISLFAPAIGSKSTAECVAHIIKTIEANINEFEKRMCEEDS